jgi:hypothetical protein
MNESSSSGAFVGLASNESQTCAETIANTLTEEAEKHLADPTAMTYWCIKLVDDDLIADEAELLWLVKERLTRRPDFAHKLAEVLDHVRS